MLRIEFEDGGLTQRLEGIALRANPLPQSIFEGIGMELIQSRLETFRQGGRPVQWPPSRSAMEDGRKTLILSGALMNANEITSVGSDHVEVTFGQGLNYSIFQQYGTKPQVTSPQQRKFFWWKFKETGLDRYKAMALSKGLKGLPARRHVQIQDDSRQNILDKLQQFILKGQERFATTVS